MQMNKWITVVCTVLAVSSFGQGTVGDDVTRFEFSGAPEGAAWVNGYIDSFYTNRLVDNVLFGTEGRCQAMAEVYAGGHDLSDPMLSPVYGDMSGFPPTILTTGTRDLLLSDTVRVHRKLRRAGVIADLHVYEAQAHAYYLCC